jgi:hypothetical protein
MRYPKFPIQPLRLLLAASLGLPLLAACSETAVNLAQATPTPIPLPAKPTCQVQRGAMVSELNFPVAIVEQEVALAQIAALVLS